MIALVCMHCNHSNLADAKFCTECGAGLLRRPCPRCHVVNGMDAHFCLDCGARLPEPEPMLTQARATVQMASIMDAPQPFVAGVAPAEPLAVVTTPGVFGMGAADGALGRRAPVAVVLGAVAAAALLALGATLWVFKLPSSGAGASVPPHGAPSPEGGVGSATKVRAAPPELPAPVAPQAAVAATAAAIGDAASAAAAAVPGAGMAVAGPASAVATPAPANTESPATMTATRPFETPAAIPSVAAAQRVATELEAARAAPKPVRRERGTAAPAGPAPLPIAPRPRPVPAIVCTPNARALGLCNLTP